MRTIYGTLVFALVATACGGGGEVAKPVEAPPAPTVAPPTTPEPAPTASATPAPAKPSVQDQQKALMGAVSDALNAHDPAKVGANYADDATLVQAGMPDPIKGKDAIQADMKKFTDAFANIKFGVSRAWAKNDVVVAEWVLSATHSGDFMGLKATEKPVGYAGLSVIWVNADGKVKEEHRYSDLGTLFAQVGQAPKGMKARAIPALPTSTEWHWAKSDATEDKALDSFKTALSVLEKKDDKAISELYTEDATWDDNMAPAPVKGRAENVKSFKQLYTGFPDLKFTPSNTWAVEDFAIGESTLTGTHKGNFMGIPATKKPVSLHAVDIIQVKDGKAAKGWTYGNSLEMMAQLGLMKPPGAAAAPAKTDAKPAAAPKGDAKGDAKPAPAAAPKGDAKPAPAPAPKK